MTRDIAQDACVLKECDHMLWLRKGVRVESSSKPETQGNFQAEAVGSISISRFRVQSGSKLERNQGELIAELVDSISNNNPHDPGA